MNKDDIFVLCIKNVEMGDVGEYIIIVNNKYGEGISIEKLEVFRGNKKKDELFVFY